MPVDGFLGFVGVGHVFKSFTGSGDGSDRARAEAVGLDAAGLAADVEFVLKLRKLDAAADVGEGEVDLVVFQDDEFLFSRRGRGLDGELGGGGLDRRLDGGLGFLQGFLALFCLG